MDDENEQGKSDLAESFVAKVVEPVIEFAKDAVSTGASDLKKFLDDGSDEAMQAMVEEHGSAYYSGQVIDALGENNSEASMLLISDLITSKSKDVRGNYEASVFDGLMSQALNAYENNGGDVAIRGVYNILEMTSDEGIFTRCEDIISNSDNDAMKAKLQAIVENRLPETLEDPQNFDDLTQ